jgi:hypothetical protein
MAFFKSLFKGIYTIVKPVIITPVAKTVSAVAPLVSLVAPSIKLPTETEVAKWIDTKVNKIGEWVNKSVNKIGEWVGDIKIGDKTLGEKVNQIGKWVGDIKIGDKTLGETGFGKFMKEGAKKLLDEVIAPKVNKFIEDSGKWIADKIVSPVMNITVNALLDNVVNPLVDKAVNALSDKITDSNSNNIDTSDITIPDQGIGIVEPANIDVTLLTKDTTTKQVSTSNKQSLEKVSKILNSKNDSSFDYQKVAKITDSSSLSSSVKDQLNSNLGYNQYEKMQDLVSNQEQVSRYQEIEQQAIENKILDQQPSEEQVVNHQILELQYQ